ncbi:MAG: hypothetical protein JSW26_29730 [Desulfobacterales bacterium]|nr:MAG: hypothetical protein JSW26_29730 [Desulfobacterales bacterium]
MFFCFASAAGYGADLLSLIEFKDNGIIDWTDGSVTAKGIGDPSTYSYRTRNQGNLEQAITEATTKARHNLLETIVGMRINARDRVIDIVENYPSMMNHLREMAYKASEVEDLRKYLYDGGVEVWSRMTFNGGFSQLILPPDIRQIESIKQVLPRPNSANQPNRRRSPEIYTGMVVDARGIEATPVIAPRILDENMEEVFGPTYASREFAVQHGVVRYATNIWQAKFDLRVSDNPIVVKALKAVWPGRCDFIISNADADKLRSASEHLLFLRECRVIIVLDPM